MGGGHILYKKQLTPDSGAGDSLHLQNVKGGLEPPLLQRPKIRLGEGGVQLRKHASDSEKYQVATNKPVLDCCFIERNPISVEYKKHAK